MQVLFTDGTFQTYSALLSRTHGWSEEQGEVGFTDSDYKPQFEGASHQNWSLSLKPTKAAHYLGQLHDNSYSFLMKAKLAIKFLSEEMPDPTCIFIIRNKRYGCEKIEANVTSSGFDRLMTGYFYEMSQAALEVLDALRYR